MSKYDTREMIEDENLISDRIRTGYSNGTRDNPRIYQGTSEEIKRLENAMVVHSDGD